MMHASSKILWVRSFLQELGFLVQGDMPMYCDNQAVVFIANIYTFHKHTKHIKIDCHAIRHRVLDAYILTKELSTTSYDSISLKLGLFDLYAPA